RCARRCRSVMMARMDILVIDVGGTHIKVLPPGRRTAIKIASGPKMRPRKMVSLVLEALDGQTFSCVSIGYPGPVKQGRPLAEPKNIGGGWVGFDFKKAFGTPVKLLNDAAMQALGCYEGGSMLFLGLGTGLGSAFITDGVLAPLELAHLPYHGGRTYEEYLGRAGLKRAGVKKWERHVFDVVARFRAALVADYVVLGGGNAK